MRKEDLKIAPIDFMLVFSNQVSHAPKHAHVFTRARLMSLGI